MVAVKLNQSDIHLWHIDQADFELADLQANCLKWLSEVELARYHRYQFDRHKKQLMLGRMLTRSVLSLYDNSVAPGDWRFELNGYGKPAIHNEQQRLPLFFNLSHSGEKLVLAVAGFEDIGVDIEQASRPRRISKIAARYFSAAEAADLLALPEQDRLQRFYQLWTLKEAYIKACGLGLAISLQHFSYSFPSDAQIVVSFDPARQDDPDRWQFWQLGIDGNFALALAARAGKNGPSQTISSWQMTGLDAIQPIDSRLIRTG